MIEIREARPEEYGAAGEVAVAGYAEVYDDLGYYEARLRDVATRATGGVVLVALDGDEVVGTVTYVSGAASPLATRQQKEGEGSIRMLAISPAHKRRGIGRALSLACVERARAGGKQAVIVHADEVMRAARTLYEGLGFRRDPARDYRPDDVTFLLCYVRDL